MKPPLPHPTILALATWVVFALTQTTAQAQRGRIEQGQITSDALADNLFGDSPTKPFKVYLPPSYDTTSNRYPVIYVLHGYGDNEGTLVTPGPGVTAAMQPTLDLMIRQRNIGEVIAVFVNGSNRLKGSFYLNSPVIGDFETYIAKDLVNLIDARYRTLSERESRGITGFSMGGWGAMHLALKFPETFSVAVAVSGFYSARGSAMDSLTRQLVLANPTTLSQFAGLPFPVNAVQALFAGLLPNPERASLFSDYPYQRINGQFVLVDSAHQRCLNADVQHGDLSRYVQQPFRLAGLKVVHGVGDPLVPLNEVRQFTNAVATAGFVCAYEQHAGGHEFRADLALPFLHSHLLGAEKFVASPQLGFARTINGLQLTFPTQAGVIYRVESSGAAESPSWMERADLLGDGQPATMSFHADTARAFFRVRAANPVP
jgi:S-formylglutathione hydrolase FrmB